MKTVEEAVDDAWHKLPYGCSHERFASYMREALASRDRDIIEQAAVAVNDGTIAGMLAAARIRALSPAGTAPAACPHCAFSDGTHAPECRLSTCRICAGASPAGTAVPEACGTCSGKRWVLRMSRPCPACSPGGEP